MKAFFFVPGNKLYKIQTMLTFGVDEIIVDFEDSLLINQREGIFSNIINIPEYKSFIYRIPLRNSFDDGITYSFLERFLEIGIRKIMIPKISSFEEAVNLIDFLSNYKVDIILLIEHPMLYLQLFDVLVYNKNKDNKIKGLALGSHDLSTYSRFENNMKNVFNIRQSILLHSSAFSIEAIDIASMNVSDYKVFEEEFNTGKSLGYNAKLLIHPIQLEWLKTCINENDSFLEEAKRIVESLPKGALSKELNPFILDGRIIEKPHIEKAIDYLKQYKDGK